jgi:hypothetical protein
VTLSGKSTRNAGYEVGQDDPRHGLLPETDLLRDRGSGGIRLMYSPRCSIRIGRPL